MATFSTTISFSLPEDVSSDTITIYQSTTENGTYSLFATSSYEYGNTTYEASNLDDTKWYKIRFSNVSDNTVGPYSDPVYGGNYIAAAPFLAVSTPTDGANYATVTDVYEYANLTVEDIASSRVSSALKRARAVIDLRIAEVDFQRFADFEDSIARRKYNASLRILKEAEINIALGNLYQNLSDDRIIENMRENSAIKLGSITVGGSSVGGDDLADRNESILFLATLSSRYFAQGEILLSHFDKNTVKLIPYDTPNRYPRFKYPFNGWA